MTLTVGDQVNFAEYEGAFEVASEIAAQPGSWQMVSLSAFDKKKVGADATFYWWDERNPVGDYWQYRAFDGGVADATRGFNRPVPAIAKSCGNSIACTVAGTWWLTRTAGMWT